MYRQFFFSLIFIVSLTSCQFFDQKRDDEPVARVHKKVLYKSDLQGLVAPGISATDSITIVKRYIENWVRQQIFLNDAEVNIGDEAKSIQRKVDDYRNSLIIYTYENQILNEKLDTLISDEVLQEYYERHINEFKLRDNIVQLNFVKLPVDAPDINLVRRLIRSEDADDLTRLEEYCINHAAGYFLDQESWFIFSDILREVPLNPSNHENFLRFNKNVELNDSFYRYFLYIREYRLEGSAAPLTFQIDNIKAIILNHRKQSLVNEFRQELYLNALKDGAFEIF
jgi:hypothetical protein